MDNIEACIQNMLKQKMKEVLSYLKPEEPVLWCTSQQSVQRDITTFLSRQGVDQQNHYIVADLPAAGGSALFPVRSVLSQLLPIIEQDLPHLLKECPPELRVLFPALEERFEGVSSLDPILAPSSSVSRMLPLESEQVFRIAMCIGWLIEQISRLFAAKQQRRLLIIFPSLDHADRPTLLTVYHLCCRARTGLFTLLLLSSLNSGRNSGAERNGLFDAAYERQLLLIKIYERIQPTMLIVSLDVAHDNQQALSVGEGMEAKLLHDTMQALTVSPLSEVRECFIHACSESIRLLNAEVVLHLAESVLLRVEEEHDTIFCAEIWLWTGIAYASIGSYDQTVVCFQKGLEYAEQTHEQLLSAKLIMYLSLVLTKRLKQFEEAEQLLTKGYAAIEGYTDVEAVLERGWLHNLRSLIRYRCGDYTQALRLTQSAFEFLRPYHGEDATALKTNLIANASMVYERVHRYERAITMWKLFSTFVDEENSTFGKYYYYRLAGLQRSAGQIADSSANIQRAFGFAERMNDWVTMEASACVMSRMAYESADYATAQRWVETAIGLLEKIGDSRRMYAFWMFAASCYYQSNNREKTISMLQAALVHTKSVHDKDAQKETEELLAWFVSEEERIALDWWERWLPAWPSTLLHLPIHLFLP